MSTVPARRTRDRTLLLHAVDWKTYTRLVIAFNERPGIRLTYDRGTLEMMCPSLPHEIDAEFLGHLVVALTDELNSPMLGGGCATLRRRRVKRGLEPDRCYWIANESLMRGKRTLDLRVDPPPDLAIEIDVTSSSLDRMGIYAALGVPEVWRLEGALLSFNSLTAGKYTVVSHSRAFPFVTPADLLGFQALRAQHGDTAVRQQFRAWVRQHLPPTP